MEAFIEWASIELGGGVSSERAAHGDQSTVYKLTSPRGVYFLKIAEDLKKERARLSWLAGKLPVPAVHGFTRIGEKEALLLSEVPGRNLADLSKVWSADKVIQKLAEALQRFHSTDAAGCPFGENGAGKVLAHGDACLPNFIFDGDKLSGYLDLGDMRVDDPAVDLSAAVWSLQYNLGPGHGLPFLREYGIKEATEEMTEDLRLRYEAMQAEWGL